LLGDFSPGDAYLPEVPQFTNPNFGPGTFLWDVVQFRTRFDRVGRGTETALAHQCSGIIAFRPTQTAMNHGFPLGTLDPYDYNDEDWTALWNDGYSGRATLTGALAVAMTGEPPLAVAGMDTLYTYLPAAWSWERIEDPDNPGEFINGVQQACGSTFGSPFLGEPIVVRYDNPVSSQGKFVWIGTTLFNFSDAESADGSISELMRGLTDWVFGTGP
jgi:hypothetical protein